MLVFMDLSQKYAVPERLGLLYDLLNTLDLRRYVEDGCAHAPSDSIATRDQLGDWMQRRALVKGGARPPEAEFAAAISLRTALRSFVEIEPSARSTSPAASRLNEIAAQFPLIVRVSDPAAPWLASEPGSSGIGEVLVQFYDLARSGELDRLKICASEDCKWIFFDRSKPGNRRWCSSTLCGNRHKTRSYRERTRASHAG